MAVTAPQTTYSKQSVAALPGMIFGNDPGELVISKIAGETILPGQVVEQDPADANKCRLPQTASAAGRFLGVAVYTSMHAGNDSSTYIKGYNAGQVVNILARGMIYALFNGTEGSDMGTMLKVNSSSTTATNRGKLTDAATSASSGVEIYALNALVLEETGTVSGIVRVQLKDNLQ